jgi:hypothetical protein
MSALEFSAPPVPVAYVNALAFDKLALFGISRANLYVTLFEKYTLRVVVAIGYLL